jgi:hypothetical protein
MTANHKGTHAMERKVTVAMIQAARNAVFYYEHPGKKFTDVTGFRPPIGLMKAVIEAALAAEETGWRSMETAPKDGTMIDLWIGTSRQPDCYWCKGSDIHGVSPGWTFDDETAGRSYEIDGEATFWMPRPDPP